MTWEFCQGAKVNWSADPIRRFKAFCEKNDLVALSLNKNSLVLEPVYRVFNLGFSAHQVFTGNTDSETKPRK